MGVEHALRAVVEDGNLKSHHTIWVEEAMDWILDAKAEIESLRAKVAELERKLLASQRLIAGFVGEALNGSSSMSAGEYEELESRVAAASEAEEGE